MTKLQPLTGGCHRRVSRREKALKALILRRASTAALIAACVLGIASAAEHKALLPQPREIQYGSGQFLIRGASIRVASADSPEDRFAAQTLAGCLSERAGSPVPVSESGAIGRSVALKRKGAIDALAGFGEQPGPDSRESYQLRVTADSAEVDANSSAGVFYGVQTLCQLAEGRVGSAVLPEVKIQDWPLLAYRGVMIDMSHGALPTEDEVKRHLDFMARWKLNQYYFYSEASIELDGFSILNPEGRFSKDQMRRLIDYARQRHIDIVPCLELYGHLHDLFRLERYAGLSAVPHGGEFNPLQPGVTKLLENWIGQMSALFPTQFFHVGMDETWELEKFAQEKAGGVSPGKIYLDHFKNVAAMLERHGKHPMVWADRFEKYPETIADLPPGTVVVPWDYGPTADYKHFVEPFGKRHVPMVVATGVTVWDQIAPDFDLSFDNIDRFLSTARPYGLIGHMNTIWTDDAESLLRASFPGIAYGAAAGWQSTALDHASYFSRYASIVYPEAVAGPVASALASLTAAESHLQQATDRDTMHHFWADPFENLKRSQANRQDLHQARLDAEDAEEKFDQALAAGGDPATLADFRLQARRIDFAAMKFLYAVEMDGFWQKLGPRPKKKDVEFLLFAEINEQNHTRFEDLLDTVTELKEDYRDAWLREYTPYRLGTALGKWQSEFEFWWTFDRRLARFAAHFHDGDALPPLASLSPNQQFR